MTGGERGLIDEPATTLTDYFIAGLCAWFAVGTFRAAAGGEAGAVWWWALSFVLTGLAAALGGTAHGFARRMSPARHAVVWRATLYALGATGFTMLVAVSSTVGGAAQGALIALGVVKLGVLARRIRRRAMFADALRDYAISMVVLAIVQGWAHVARRAPSAPWVLAAVVVSFAAGAVQLWRVTPHRRFNHNDLYHVVQMGALYLFYRGGLLLGA